MTLFNWMAYTKNKSKLQARTLFGATPKMCVKLLLCSVYGSYHIYYVITSILFVFHNHLIIIISGLFCEVSRISSRIALDQTGSDWIRLCRSQLMTSPRKVNILDQTGSDWIKLDQNLSILDRSGSPRICLYDSWAVPG